MNIDFEHLAKSSEFAEFTNLLMKVTGLAMALNSPEGIIHGKFKTKGGSPLCTLIRNSLEGRRRCINCDIQHHKKAILKGKAQLYVCHAGLLDMAVPIFVQERHIATLSSGQILPKPPDEKNFRSFLNHISWFDCAQNDLRDAYFKSQYIPRKNIKYIMKLLELFAKELCESLQKIKNLEAQLERNEFRRAKAFVEKKFQNPSLGLSEVAAYAGLSSAHFSHIFKQSTGMSFVKLVQIKRIAKAKKMMLNSSLSITEICFACGFNSVSNFNKVFRKLEHCSPRDFRKKLSVNGV